MFFILQKVKFPCPWIPASTLGINRIQTRLVCRLEISPFFLKSISKTGFWLCSCLTAFLWLTGITDNDSLHCVKHWTPAMIVVFPSVLDNSISQHVHLVVLTTEQISVHFPGCLHSSPSELTHILNQQSWNINNIQCCYQNLFSHIILNHDTWCC